MARHLVMVGTGDYWKGLVKPSLDALTQDGLIDGVTTIDVVEDSESEHHVVREEDQPLSEIVDSLGHEQPYVLLAHPNQLHVPDTQELLENAQTVPKILMEKPYAINDGQFSDLWKIREDYSERIALLEYYLTMKGVPLLVFGGVVNPESFYFEDNGILVSRSPGHLPHAFSNQFQEVIGRPLHIVSDVLEGEGSYGSVEHRNISLVDRRMGGGMIQDLGHHAITSLMGLEHIVGNINAGLLREVRVAYCEEYQNAARAKGITEKHIGESYAELNFVTGKGIPVHVRLGKYVEEGSNQRRIIITGTRGVMMYDMTNNILAFQRGDSTEQITPLLEADKTGKVSPKYLPVIRAGMEQLEGRNPFAFDPQSVAFEAQGIVLHALKLASGMDSGTTYKAGARHDTIFRR